MALDGRLKKRLEQALTLYEADMSDDLRWQFVHSFVYAQPGAAALEPMAALDHQQRDEIALLVRLPVAVGVRLSGLCRDMRGC
jgi:hypothetical protein